MHTDLHLAFPGTCHQAFDFYEQVFGAKRFLEMKYSDAPGGAPVPEDSKHLVMHTSLPLGNLTLMGCDEARGHEKPISGVRVAITFPTEDECRAIYAALSDGGNPFMPLAPTFWSPLFGMCTDKFGVSWMVGVPGPTP